MNAIDLISIIVLAVVLGAVIREFWPASEWPEIFGCDECE
jgi:hypothetical protein